MKIINFFYREAEFSRGPLIITVLFSALSNSALIMIVNAAAEQIANQNLETRLFMLFIVVFSLFVYTQHHALTTISVAFEKIIFKVRVRIADKIRHARLDYIEHNGIDKLYTQLMQNSDVLSEEAIGMSFIVQSAVLAVMCILYLGMLSPWGLVLYCIFLGAGAYIYLLYNEEVLRNITQARAQNALFLNVLNHILDGFKELKLHRKKSDAVITELKSISKATETLRSDTKRRQSMLMIYGQAVFYLLLAVMVFLVPLFTTASNEQVHELIATNLFIIGPISVVVGMIPVLNRVNVSVINLEQMEHELDGVMERFSQQIKPKTFQSLRLVNVGYDYQDAQREVLFSVRNLNLSLAPGEMVFIVGGNGSGKTTFLKLLTGLYLPTEGHLECNGQKLRAEEYLVYRQWFATVFTDFHLFDKLYGLGEVKAEQVQALLEKMELTHKTSYQQGRFTHTELSTGQRKRLAFISGYLEDKPIYIFDELAADQDPQFRRRFYQEILPDLRAKGKTIVAVTHDDTYFSVADRVLKMDNGYFVPYNSTAV